MGVASPLGAATRLGLGRPPARHPLLLVHAIVLDLAGVGVRGDPLRGPQAGAGALPLALGVLGVRAGPRL